MKTLKFTPWFFLGIGLLVAIPLLVGYLQTVQAADGTNVVYKPPVKTAPIRRVGAGSRGSCKQVSEVDNTFALQVLAPDPLGQTASTQPTLYWWISKPVSGQFTFVITGDSGRFSEPLINTTKKLSVTAGVQAFSLTENNVTLQPATNYNWSVSLECDADDPSLNIVSTGVIKYVAPATELSNRFKQAPPEKLPYLYAISSYWYDSLSSLAALIQKQPDDRKWHQVRTNLLRQGGLEKVTTNMK